MANRGSASPGPLGQLLDLERRHIDLDFLEIRERILEGDPRAWSVFVERYSRTVYTLALQLSGFHESREEVAHEVYLGLFERLARDRYRLLREFRGDSRFETYLFTAVRNEVAHRRRQWARERNQLTQHDDESFEGPAPDEPFSESIGLDRGKVAQLVTDALARLDPTERTLLVLRFREGLSLRKLAEFFGWKDTNAAAYQVCRTLRKLDLLRRCRETQRWGEPEQDVLRRCLEKWLQPVGHREDERDETERLGRS